MHFVSQLLFMLLAVNVCAAGPAVLTRKLITLPANAGRPLFVDVDGDGRSDLLVIDEVEKKLLNFHQRQDGFTNSPDQIIPLPPQTAWVALCDVDAHPGLELLMSTATGLVYSRQNAGLFEAERRTLIEAGQVFTNNDFPFLTSLSTNEAGTNVLIPVITAGQTVLYHRNSVYEWSPGPPQALEVGQSSFHVNSDQWSMGQKPAHSLRVQKTFRGTPEKKLDDKPESEAIRKIMDDMKKHDAGGWPQMQRVDVNGDGREDLVLWQTSGKLEFKTDIYIFIRGADQKLPDHPTQVMHCRGFAIPMGSNYEWSPVHDLKGDGSKELVLVEFKTVFTSPSGLLEMALARGLDCSLTIRSSHGGAFSHSPEASVPVTLMLSLDDFGWLPLGIEGDFNGDGRSDLLVKRSPTQWNIFFSTRDGRWFASQPSMTFDAPAQSYIEIKDLNGDGLSDIIWHERDKNQLSIFMSPSGRAKGRNP